MIQLELFHLALVGPTITLMHPLNTQIEAALSGSEKTKPPLQASELLVLWITQQAGVVKLHQGICGGRIMSTVEPSDFVEKRTRCT